MTARNSSGLVPHEVLSIATEMMMTNDKGMQMPPQLGVALAQIECSDNRV